MASIRLEDLTQFGQLAVKLDREFSELSRVGGQIAHVDIQTDAGLDEGIKILNRVAAHGEVIAETMQGFAKALQEEQGKAQAATDLVAEKAELIKQRRQLQNEMQEKLSTLKEAILKTGEALAASNQLSQSPTEEDKRRIAAELARMQEPLDLFIATAQEIKEEAARSNFKRLERQADSVIDSLQASRRKIAEAIAPKS